MSDLTTTQIVAGQYVTQCKLCQMACHHGEPCTIINDYIMHWQKEHHFEYEILITSDENKGEEG